MFYYNDLKCIIKSFTLYKTLERHYRYSPFTVEKTEPQRCDFK